MLIYFSYSIVALLLLIQIGITVLLVLYMLSWLQSAIWGAPFVPISAELVKKMLVFGGIKSIDVVCDLGCGDGRILISAVNDFNVARAIGYEIAFWPYLMSRYKIRRARLMDKIQIFREDIMKADLRGVSFVYAYLFPQPVDRVADKIERELMVGGKILVPSFPIDIQKHGKIRLIKSEKMGKITAYLYEKI